MSTLDKLRVLAKRDDVVGRVAADTIAHIELLTQELHEAHRCLISHGQEPAAYGVYALSSKDQDERLVSTCITEQGIPEYPLPKDRVIRKLYLDRADTVLLDTAVLVEENKPYQNSIRLTAGNPPSGYYNLVPITEPLIG